MGDHDLELEDEGEEIILTDEEGVEHEFTVVRVMQVDGKDYVFLEPLHDEHELSPVILRIEAADDGEEGDDLVMIDDDEEFQRVAEAFEELPADDEAEEDTTQ